MKEVYSIPEKVKFIRQELNLSVVELSKLINVSDSSIKHYESGLRNPSKKVFKNLAKISGLSEQVLKDNDVEISKLNTTGVNNRLAILEYMRGEKYGRTELDVVRDMLNGHILINKLIPVWENMSRDEKNNIIAVFVTEDLK